MILNLTQHPATDEQVAAGVVNLHGEELAMLKRVLTFDALPSRQDIEEVAETIADIAAMNGLGGDDGEDPVFTRAMIGGAPFLMSALESVLRAHGIAPLYAFSRRESVEEKQADGSVRKVAVFRHAGFVDAGNA